jgi:hypothetical protein
VYHSFEHAIVGMVPKTPVYENKCCPQQSPLPSGSRSRRRVVHRPEFGCEGGTWASPNGEAPLPKPLLPTHIQTKKLSMVSAPECRKGKR